MRDANKSAVALVFGMAILLLNGCVSGNAYQATEHDATAAVSATAQSIRASARQVGDQAMAWQLGHMDQFEDYIPKMHHTADPRNWVQGAFYIGLTQWVDATGNQAGMAALDAVARTNNYELGDRKFHADDHAIGQTYLWLFEQSGKPIVYGPTLRNFAEIMAANPTNSLELVPAGDPSIEHACKKRWCWSDALFMAPRTWLMLSNATGDPRYFEYADKEFWATTDYLYSKQHDLYFRDSRYFDQRSSNGAPVFWSRGNGWVFAALPMIIEDIPAGHPSRGRYVDLYVSMAEKFVHIQKPDGYWAPSLLDSDAVNTPETSGTGFITYGLAWGVNNGLLNDQASIDAAKKGWAALAASVGDDGRVHWVQQIGKSPDPVEMNHTQLYGVGAVLLAASEMLSWGLPEKEVKAYGRQVPERIDDFAWENDKVAFRVYGPAASKTGVSSGVDAWLKSVDYSIIDKWYAAHLKGISYHVDKGEGYDPYHTGASRGVGASVIWMDGKAWSAGPYKGYRIVESGGDQVVFTLQYEIQTPVGKVTEYKTVSLRLGSQLFDVESAFTLHGKPAELTIAVGVTTHDEKAVTAHDRESGWVSAWEVIDDLGIGTGALVDPDRISKIEHVVSDTKDQSHIWIHTRTDAAGTIAYRAGFSWEAAGEILTPADWHAYLRAAARQ